MTKCLQRSKDALLKLYIQEDNYSSAKTRFQNDDFIRKTKVYGALVDDNRLSEARIYLNSLIANTEEETDFKTIQNFNIDLLEGGFQPFSEFTSEESEERNERLAIIYDIAMKPAPMSGYARSLYFVMTGVKLELEINHGERKKIDSFDNKQIEKYELNPNPVGNEFVLKSNSLTENKWVEVYDINGKLIFSKKVSLLEQEFSTSNWMPGVYILRLLDEKGSFLWNKKFVKI